MTTMPLHRDGYQIFPSQFAIGDNVYQAFKTEALKSSKYIFNSKRNDFKRKQTSIRPSKVKTGFLKQIGEFLATKYPTHSPKNWVVLYSRAGCLAQEPHMDYIPTAEFTALTDGQMPLSALIALENGTKFRCWHPETREKMDLALNAGDVLIFRGDLIHAGSSYEVDNIRLHCFLDNPHYSRRKNSTFIVGDVGLEEYR